MTWASVARLDLLGSEYALAVEECAVEPEEADFSREKWAPCRSLVHHLCAFYCSRYIPLSNRPLISSPEKNAGTIKKEKPNLRQGQPLQNDGYFHCCMPEDASGMEYADPTAHTLSRATSGRSGRLSRDQSACGVFGGLADFVCAVLAQVGLRETRCPEWFGEERKIKTILRHGFGACIPEATRISAEIQDELLRLGRFQFRNLGEGNSDR